MTQPQDVQARFAATLVDEWARCGVRDAVVCPGSRSTPLALALADHGGLAVHVHQDERSGGFLALGLALASGRPVVVLTTSGTAATELHPAVTEAHHAGVPLLVCTADRPPELRDVGAPQTIDQIHLYGRTVRWFGDPGVADAAGAGGWRPFAARAFAATVGVPPGPVHLNLPFREPLVGTPGPLPSGRPGGAPWTTVSGQESAGTVAVEDVAGRRGLLLVGHPAPGRAALVTLAESLGWPVVAEPRSSAWGPSPVGVDHLDAILRSARAAAELRPEVILRLGSPPASRVVNEWCAASGAREIVVPGGSWSDPAGSAAVVVPGHPEAVVAELAQQIASSDPPVAPPSGWLDQWRAVAKTARDALAEALVSLPSPLNEPAVARDVVAALPAGAQLVVSSSMPIRDVERYATPRDGVRILANRGANGIDGVVSTAVGAAVAAVDGATGQRPTTGLLIGDLAFVHDSNGLLGAAGRGIDLVCVVVDNDGGGIFSFLPQARCLPEARFERLFGTPHGLDLVQLAQAYGVAARTVQDDIAKAVTAAAEDGGVTVLVVRTDRSANVEAHRVIDDAIATAVDELLAAPTA